MNDLFEPAPQAVKAEPPSRPPMRGEPAVLHEPSGVEPEIFRGEDATTPVYAGIHVPVSYFAAIQKAALDQEARHRHEVELVAGFETHAKRTWYLDGEGGVRESRGDEAANRLRRDVWALLKSREPGRREPRHGTPRNFRRQQVLEAVAEHGPMTITQLALATDRPYHQVQKIVAKLIAAGELVRRGRGYVIA